MSVFLKFCELYHVSIDIKGNLGLSTVRITEQIPITKKIPSIQPPPSTQILLFCHFFIYYRFLGKLGDYWKLMMVPTGVVTQFSHNPEWHKLEQGALLPLTCQILHS